jgi:hypothetical protein
MILNSSSPQFEIIIFEATNLKPRDLRFKFVSRRMWPMFKIIIFEVVILEVTNLELPILSPIYQLLLNLHPQNPSLAI